MPQSPRRCPGPGCSLLVLPTSPLPDFCCFACADHWRTANIDTEGPPVDGGLGRAYAGDASRASHRMTSTNILSYAPPWLDARPHPADEVEPT